jgi:hypothetical protein
MYNNIKALCMQFPPFWKNSKQVEDKKTYNGLGSEKKYT